MFMKFLLRQIFENRFFAQKKQENRRLFFLFHSFPFSASSSYPVTLSDLAGYNSKSSHNFTKIPPSLLFIVSSLTSRFQPFCLLFFSFFKPFSFARLLVASSQQGTKSSKLLAVERFVIRSHRFTSTIVLSLFDFHTYFIQSLFSFCLVFSPFLFF